MVTRSLANTIPYFAGTVVIADTSTGGGAQDRKHFIYQNSLKFNFAHVSKTSILGWLPSFTVFLCDRCWYTHLNFFGRTTLIHQFDLYYLKLQTEISPKTELEIKIFEIVIN